ncbi:universal stress protein [Tranquillimonas rosea]|uniref:universal stress protein n=1 Tax=Tranquillimonas rosea TaxID=641238 RepID=UPI003BAD7E4E
MKPKTIAIAFYEETGATELARAAAALAGHHGAHLLGLFVMPEIVRNAQLSIHVPPEVLHHARAEHVRVSEQIETQFNEAARREDVRSEWRHIDPDEDQTMADALLDSARAADLVLLGQPAPELRTAGQLHETVIRNVGRPVLIVPHREIGDGLHRSAVIGWSPTREATRAAFDTTGLLDAGARIRLLHVGRPDGRDLAEGPLNAMAEALARHGFDVTVSYREPHAEKIVDVIEHEAAEHGGDFIATGAFGHSRAYDFIIGAVSWDLMTTAERPVLFSK